MPHDKKSPEADTTHDPGIKINKKTIAHAIRKFILFPANNFVSLFTQALLNILFEHRVGISGLK